MARRHHDQVIVTAFTRQAKGFARHPAMTEADGLARLLAAAAITADARVLDVACGPGIVACAAAAQAGQVLGVDLTPAMIAQAQWRQRRLGLSNVDWLIGDATALPLPLASFDVVLTRYSFHHFANPAAVLAEVCRVCRPGGRIVIADVTPQARARAAYDAMERLRDPSHVGALTAEELRDLGREAGLVAVDHDGYRLDVALADVADPGVLPELTALLDADIAAGSDAIGVGARRTGDGIRFHFPVSIMAWQHGR
jgi:SAM-dependent methyltransferase